MKAPPKRKGNPGRSDATGPHFLALNESPSEKEGKFRGGVGFHVVFGPSMKAPPKRKGNSPMHHGVTTNVLHPQ